MAATSRLQMPAALITYSASIAPWLVTTRRYAASAFFERGDDDILDDLHAAGAGACRVGIGETGRIDVAVAGDPRGADDAGRLEQRKQLLRLPRGNEVDVKAESLGHRRRTLELLPPRRRRSETHAADAMPAGGLPGLGLELAVQFGRVTHEARQIAAAAQLPDQSRGVPGRAVRQLQPLQQHDVALAALGQVIRDAAANGAAADDDDAAALRVRPCVRSSISFVTIPNGGTPRTGPRKAGTSGVDEALGPPSRERREISCIENLEETVHCVRRSVPR